MGQFMDYIASVFTSKVELAKEKTNNRLTFTDNSFTQTFSRNDSQNATKIASLIQSNKKTIQTYQCIGAVSFLVHLSMVTVPKIQLEKFDFLEPDGWQLVTLSLVPFVVYLASICAMNEINQPISEGTKLTSKNSGLDLNNNEFIQSLKIIILLMAMCQISSIFSDQLLWSVVMIVPIWCYQLTTKIAQSEYQRYAPSPKKSLFKLNIKMDSPKAPKATTPIKHQTQLAEVKADDSQVRATPRTRTRRAVKNIITGVTDKYHAFEQNVAHSTISLSQKMFAPPSPKLKMVEQ